MHRHTSWTMQLYKPPELELSPMYTHHQCPHNVYVGLTARHLVDNNPCPDWLEHTKRGMVLKGGAAEVIPGYTQADVIRAAHKVALEWVDGRYVDLASTADYVQQFSGAKRTRLVRAIKDAEQKNCLNWKVTGFVKCDKYSKEAAETKAPRMIQFRNPAVNADLAKVMGPAEHELLLGPGCGPTRTPDSSKGMNLTRRAEVWHEKRYAFADAVCVMGDFSKFDAHVSTQALKLEHYVWRAISGRQMEGLDNQLINHGTAAGHYYTAAGTRMSGDRNTGGGNTIIVVVLLRLVAKLSNTPVEILVDGDDHNIWMPRKKEKAFREVATAVFTRVFGMRWEAPSTTRHNEEEYCHAALSYSASGQPICVVDPIRHMERACFAVNRQGRRQLAEILVGNLISAYLMYPHTPIVSRACYAALRSIGAVSGDLVAASYTLGEENQWLREFREQHVTKHQAVEEGRVTTRLPLDYMQVSEEAREATAAAYGITADEQVRYEHRFWGGQMNPIARLTKPRGGSATQQAEVLGDTNDQWSQFYQ